VTSPVHRLAVAALACTLAACARSEASPPAPGEPSTPTLTSVAPGTLVPGSTLIVRGHGFVAEAGSELHLRGPFELSLPLRFVSGDELHAAWPGAPEGSFAGQAWVTAADGGRSAPLALAFELRTQISPRLDAVQAGVVFVNDTIAIAGDGFLLGGDEGASVAIVEGCWRTTPSASCTPLAPRELPTTSGDDRRHLGFVFAPELAGIRPGQFEGTVRVENRHASGVVTTSAPSARAVYTLVPPAVFELDPGAASLGQYVDIRGGGFVPGTLIELEGSFAGSPVTLTLVPEHVDGRHLRYVLDDGDALGQRLDLRHGTGTFTGTARPIVAFAGDEVRGDATSVTLAVAPIRQVVWLDFRPSYVESLRHFGLRAASLPIQRRVLAVAARDYAGVNLDFRTAEPDDFALYERVEIAGPDPNGLGLLGYDNSPGKDVGNQRLYDQIGGVNATTQADGFPGYGGIFVESFFGFSPHPGAFADQLPGGSDPIFDAIFDPFRPDRGGRPVSAADLDDLPTLADGSSCPALLTDRRGQVACAIWVLGSMIGTTMTHEVGHSLGLANPADASAFHDPGDQPDRLMDTAAARSFRERAELMGEGPAVFCDGEYAYLRQILPTPDATTFARPTCF